MSDRGDLTEQQLHSFREYASESMTEASGDQCQWADYTVRLVDEVRRRRAGERVSAGMRQALESIILRCEEGDPRTDWLPTIADIARRALPAPPEADRE